MSRLRIVALAAAAALATSCGPKTEVVNTEVADLNFAVTEPEAGVTVPATPQTSYTDTASWGEWRALSEVDPMSDMQSNVGQIDVLGRQHDVRITARCKPDATFRLSYQVDGFDKQGSSSEIDERYGLEWREDHGQSHSSGKADPRFPNRTEIEWYQVLDVTQARTLTLKVFFADGDEVYRVDQSQPAFRRVIAPCTDGGVAAPRPTPPSSEQAEPMAAAAPSTDVSADPPANEEPARTELLNTHPRTEPGHVDPHVTG